MFDVEFLFQLLVYSTIFSLWSIKLSIKMPRVPVL
jgi:hypothetical protein